MDKVARPRIDIVPHHADGPPELWTGAHKYQFDEVTALYFCRVLFAWLYDTAHRDKGPSDAMTGDP